MTKTKSKARTSPRGTLHEVMRGRSGGKGPHTPRGKKRRPSKARRYLQHE